MKSQHARGRAPWRCSSLLCPSPVPSHITAELLLAFLVCSPPPPPPLPSTNPTQSSKKLSQHGKFPAKNRVQHPDVSPQRPFRGSRLCQGGLAATSFPDTAVPRGFKADVNSPSAARWCKGKSLHGKAPAELTSRLFPAPKSQRSCSPLISVCHN